jgi:NADPH:quinone reductase
MMVKAIRFDKTGGPEVMKWVDVEVGEPGAGELRIRQTAVGLNYIDIYFRTGLYPLPLPGGLGMEAAGEVTAVGAGVTGFKAGDRVAYVARPPGAYTQERVLAAAQVVKVPDALTDEQAASVMLQGLTAQYLLRRTYPVKAGDTILIQAAAGGVGLLVCQWAKALGATVIGTVGSDEKAEIAKAHGCDHAIVYTRENFTKRVREITNGAGVPVVYDSIGKDTFTASLDCLAPLGMFVSFGNASGPLPPIDSSEFAGRGSLFFTRPTLFTYIAKRAEYESMSTELFDVLVSGKVKTSINQRYALADVGQAHADLEGRRTTGSTVLLP